MKGDCLERMKEIPDGSVDLILTDPPYGATACKWDSVIPLEPMWEQLKRIIKPNGAIVMTAAQPFTTTLIASNIRMFHHQWVWDKKFAANFPQAKRQPLRVNEDILVFGVTPKYYPQMIKRDVPIKKGANKGARVFGGVSGLGRKDYEKKVYDEKYPDTILSFSSRSEARGLHPTQKPVALMEYLIKTYTNEDETVLDFTMGSGTTGAAAKNLNRSFIGIELDDKYFEIAKNRIENA
jgi:site-specific DNA-methyltransferase (adenine-specific)